MEITNFIYIIAVFGSWLIAQGIKAIIPTQKEGLSWKNLINSGGMPSSHVALVTSIMVTIGFHDGFYTSMFGLSGALWGVVVYDSVGVRRITGENTQILRQISQKLKIGDQRTAMYLALGHTPYQAFVGFLIGLAWGLVVVNLLS